MDARLFAFLLAVLAFPFTGHTQAPGDSRHPEAAAPQAYNPAIDVQHYDFSLRLDDGNDRIKGEAAVTLTFSDGAANVLPDSAALTSGQFLPTTWTSVSSFQSPAPPDSGGTAYTLPGSSNSGRTSAQTLIGHGYTDQDFSTLLLLQAKASGIELKPENVEIGDGLSAENK